MPNTSHARFDLVIRNGSVLDGTGAAEFSADIGVRDQRIAAIGPLEEAEADIEFDAAGRTVAPGFIDVHTHDDNSLLAKADMGYKTSQGVTTVVVGNCGVSLAPLAFEGDRPPPPLDLLGEHFKFPHMRDFFAATEADPAATNAAVLCGHTTLRVGAMDNLQHPATQNEIAIMQDNLAEALDAGAVGMSTGLAYPPAEKAPTEEVLQLAELLGPADALYTTHLRDEGNDIVNAMEEAFRIGRESGAGILLSHHKVIGHENFGRSEETLALIDRVAKEQRVDFDVYPYDAASTVLQKSRVADSRKVLVTWSIPHPEATGRDLSELAEEMGCSVDEAIDRLQPAGAIYFAMDEADVERIIAHPGAIIASDGLPNDIHPHPRLWGTFPRVLGRYSRERGTLSMADAVHRMTGKPAGVFGFSERGLLAEGYWADVTIFDPDTVIDRADFENPTEPAAGIDAVFVNGEPVWRDGAVTGRRPGHILKRQDQQRPATQN